MKTRDTIAPYPKLTFSVDEGLNCCGHAVVYNVERQYQITPTYVDRKFVKNYVGHDTFEDMVKDFLQRIEHRFEQDAEEHWSRDDEDERQSTCYAFATMTLYRGQIVFDKGGDLIDALLENGWKLLQEGINPKTSNRIVNLGRDV